MVGLYAPSSYFTRLEMVDRDEGRQQDDSLHKANVLEITQR